MNLDADDIERIQHLDLDLVRRRITALRRLPMARGSADARFVRSISQRRAVDLTPDELHRVAVMCWARRRRDLPHGLAPRINPGNPLSPDRLALEMGCTPTVAQARMELSGAKG